MLGRLISGRYAPLFISGIHIFQITVTNVSLSINSFKILALPDSVRDFFEISYKPPGHISAGLATEVVGTYYDIVLISILKAISHFHAQSQ